MRADIRYRDSKVEVIRATCAHCGEFHLWPFTVDAVSLFEMTFRLPCQEDSDFVGVTWDRGRFVWGDE